MTIAAAFVNLVFTRGAISGCAETIMRSSVTAAEMTPHRILCYGDSLTAGTVPPDLENYPYGPDLEKLLNEQVPAVVRWKGLPGWTASAMVENADDGNVGLRAAIRRVKDPPLALVIILAGTNDLAFATSSKSVADSIISLHKMSKDEGVEQTVAVAVPPSGWQSQDRGAQQMADEVNCALKTFCDESAGTSTFVPFPFPYEQGGANWAPDGLHFSPSGYNAMAVGIAPTISKILTK